MRRFDKQADPFYSGRAWRKVRQQALNRDGGMCVECMAEFMRCQSVRPRQATVVHHVIPREERPDLALDLNNLKSLCDDHHAKAHPEKGERGSGAQSPLKPLAGMPTIVKI